MTQSIPEIRAAIKAAGFIIVITFGGPRTVDEWKPYGREESLVSVAMEVVGDAVVEHPIETTPYMASLVMGRWPLSRLPKDLVERVMRAGVEPNSIKIITPEERPAYFRMYGIPNAVDEGRGFFGKYSGSLFVDDFDEGKPKAYLPGPRQKETKYGKRKSENRSGRRGRPAKGNGRRLST